MSQTSMNNSICYDLSYIKTRLHIYLTLQKTTKNSLSLAGFELASSSFWTAYLPIELLSQLGLEAVLLKSKRAKCSRDDLKLVFEEAQCFIYAVAKPGPTFGHANANFSVFIDRIRNQFLKKRIMIMI